MRIAAQRTGQRGSLIVIVLIARMRLRAGARIRRRTPARCGGRWDSSTRPRRAASLTPLSILPQEVAPASEAISMKAPLQFKRGTTERWGSATRTLRWSAGVWPVPRVKAE